MFFKLVHLPILFSEGSKLDEALSLTWVPKAGSDPVLAARTAFLGPRARASRASLLWGWHLLSFLTSRPFLGKLAGTVVWFCQTSIQFDCLAFGSGGNRVSKLNHAPL